MFPAYFRFVRLYVLKREKKDIIQVYASVRQVIQVKMQSHFAYKGNYYQKS